MELHVSYTDHSAKVFVVAHCALNSLRDSAVWSLTQKQTDFSWHATRGVPCEKEEESPEVTGHGAGTQLFLLFFSQLRSSECVKKIQCSMQRFAETQCFGEVSADSRLWSMLKEFHGDQELLICISVVWIALCQSAETIISQLLVPPLSYEIILVYPVVFQIFFLLLLFLWSVCQDKFEELLWIILFFFFWIILSEWIVFM